METLKKQQLRSRVSELEMADAERKRTELENKRLTALLAEATSARAAGSAPSASIGDMVSAEEAKQLRAKAQKRKEKIRKMKLHREGQKKDSAVAQKHLEVLEKEKQQLSERLSEAKASLENWKKKAEEREITEIDMANKRIQESQSGPSTAVQQS